MVVSVVELAADAYLTCLTHALTTEKEEVMGLLLGEVSYPFSLLFEAHLASVASLARSSSPVQMSIVLPTPNR